ncbi:MAG: hypothetical protein HYV33_03265 [Candidatus Kerfeldbacteria bacterium]|nr:hypothetical protein [Candidatus Kerfeldbacteria bacterium]
MPIKRWRQPSGMTLIEVLISASVFIIVIVVVVDLFLLFYRSSYNQAEQEQLQAGVLYFSQIMSRHVRTSKIDYDRYGSSIVNPVNVLYLAEQYEDISIQLGDSASGIGNDGQVYLYEFDSNTLSPLTSDAINAVYVDTVQFFIYPATDPFDRLNLNPPNTQPTVMLVVSAHHVDDPSLTIQYQTLISLRQYER